MNDETHGMGLECDEREGGANRVAEPEPEGNRQLEWARRLNIRIYIPMTHHLVETVALIGSDRQLRPDLEPFSGMLVNLLFADFDPYILNESVSDVICPVTGRHALRDGGKVDLEKHGP